MNLYEVIQKNDEKMKKREDVLIHTIDTVYESSIKDLIKRYKELEALSPEAKVSNEEVRKLINQIGKEFSEKFEVLVTPIKKAMYDSYVEGLVETTEFLKESLKEKK